MDKIGKPPVLNSKDGFEVEEQQPDDVRGLQAYHDWFYQYVMPPDQDGYSHAIMALPWTTGEPVYRDTHKTGLPHASLPVGSIPYISRDTGKEERRPAALGLVSAEGSDVMLTDLSANFSRAQMQSLRTRAD
ncbi:hypothetical protein ISF_02634 [Cordyceps fumosorosea ARSEF 2679]|uniref:Uncharacterized protein n=1 Tax=Cordyceps fumosorosea (strain ARSEF 2679) TaxID=1081104 RepID=A0A168BX57_CORFA|nr:hypothetical protein ISF_02634 [Cordyceps fumosorosea ARSEF 2679]OAA70660.1 hypothetical protein ISF_02634 [Cordyceps fumosorosea ARSEF 2679]